MRKFSLGLMAALCSGIALADHRDAVTDYAKVTRAEPIYEEVAYRQPRERCWEETVAYRERSHTAPILGAIIGGAIGNELGHGHSNKKVGAVVGAALGASIASDASRHHGGTSYHTEQHCTTVSDVHYRQEVVGYNVTYRYHGRLYHTRLPYDPGKHIKVRIDVMPAE